jgi:RIO kinase 1
LTHWRLNDLLSEDFDLTTERRGRAEAAPKLHRAHQERYSDHAVVDDILAHVDVELGAETAFSPTFSASRYERLMILNYLGPFYDKQQISDVLRRVKGGKEANVYCCAGGRAIGLELVAAKVYRPRQFRHLRNDALYRQGRELLNAHGKPLRDRRALLAAHQGTRLGKEFEHVSWLAHEFQTLRLLHDAGVRVPQPLAQGNNTILMAYAGDAARPAPALNEVALAPIEAADLLDRLLADVGLMLACGRVHADLSAYNVLYTGNDYYIIDFPQAIDPAVHPEAYPIFRRDVTRLCQYFARQGVSRDAGAVAEALWAEHGPGPLAS